MGYATVETVFVTNPIIHAKQLYIVRLIQGVSTARSLALGGRFLEICTGDIIIIIIIIIMACDAKTYRF
jgi:hypothetical protein